MNLSVSRLLPPFQVAICQSDALSITLQRGIAQEIITTKYNSWANTIPEVVQNNNMSESSSGLSNLCQSLYSVVLWLRK